MKNWLLVLLVLFFYTSSNIIYGQEKSNVSIPKYYSDIIDYVAQSKVKEIKCHNLKEESKNDRNSHVSYAEYISIDNNIWNNRDQGMPNSIGLTLYFKGNRIPLVMKRRHIKNASYQLSTSKSRKRESVQSFYYHGVVEGDYESWATMAFIGGEYKMLIASKEGNIEIDKIEGNRYAVYESIDLAKKPEYKCLTDEAASLKPRNNQDDRSVGSDCVELYIECDHQSYIDNGSSVANTEAWALALMNDVATIYNTINIPLVVNNVFVWNSSDPYSASTSIQAVRDSFVTQIQNTYDGAVAQLFSTRPMGGGLAYGVGGLCGSYPDFPGPYTVATSLATSYDPYPNFSFTVNVVAHELGHVFGARHTHACVWGANFDTQIDDCGNVYAIGNGDQPEGQGCFDENNPILPTNGGTIMSFCNLAGGGIDLANGFGTEVGDFIYDEYINATCATGTQCASLPPSNDDCVNALELPANGKCSLVTYDNIMASSSGVSDPSCGTAGSGLDVWFQFTASFTDYNLNFNPVAGQVEDVIISLYSGTCGSLVEETCEEGTNEQLTVKLTGLTIGDTYYIRIIETGSDEFGDFELCLVNDQLPCHPAHNQLIDLYNNTNGAAWTNNSGWIDGATSNCEPCTWHGITCDNQNNVIGIDLYNNNLVGTVPTSLGELTKLRILKLMNNDLSGVFPDIWTNLTALEFIDLSNNNFTGSMPTSLGSLIKLNTLYIENNNMDGPLLPEIADLPLINVYWTKNNDFSGCYPDSYLELCDIASTKFTNNPSLPSSGNDFDGFCSQGLGGDMDDDGFCFGSNPGEDCVDDDNTIYPNAPELCDGKDNDCDQSYDEGLVETNSWAIVSGGDWNLASNWSLGIVPQSCHDVIFPLSGTSRIIEVGLSQDAFARSVTIFGNNTLINNGDLSVSGSDDHGMILNTNGSFTNGGTTDINNISQEGIRTDGNIDNSGSIIIENLGTDFEVYILPNSYFVNNGVLRLK